jgi:hypothetical protein
MCKRDVCTEEWVTCQLVVIERTSTTFEFVLEPFLKSSFFFFFFGQSSLVRKHNKNIKIGKRNNKETRKKKVKEKVQMHKEGKPK